MGTQKSYFLRGGDLVSFTWWRRGNSSCAGRLIWGFSDSKLKPKPVTDDDCYKDILKGGGISKARVREEHVSRKMNVVLRQKVGEKIENELRASSSSYLSCEDLKKERLSELSEVGVS